MAYPIRYFVNHKTRMCQMLGGRGEGHEEDVRSALKSGFVETNEQGLDSFREETQILLEAGWNKSPRSLNKYLHLLVKP